jgi:hypothetical protein
MIEPTVKLYAAAFLAWREENGQPTVRIKPGIVLAASDDEAHTEGMGGAFAALPESEGWGQHEVVFTELPKSLVLGNYDVTWEAIKIGS